MIRVSNITKKFGNVTAVSSLSLEVQQGEIFGIVGPDGAGKSTLLRLMSGILDPDKGKIVIDEADISKDLFRVKENLAYMPQRFGLYEDLSVEENIYFFGRLFGLSKSEIKKRIPRLYEFSRLGPFHGRLAGKLSGGMKQKLGLACCLVHSPELILLDEPTNGVDPVSRREFWKILYDLLGEGVTIVVSTAYLDEAERCNRVALMHEGAFVNTGKPSDVKKAVKRTLLEIHTSEAWKAEKSLRGIKEFGNIIREGTALRVFVEQAAEAKKNIAGRLKKQGIEVDSITTKIPSLEDCFVEIVSGEGDSETGEII